MENFWLQDLVIYLPGEILMFSGHWQPECGIMITQGYALLHKTLLKNRVSDYGNLE
jgi:hypothetical protein